MAILECVIHYDEKSKTATATYNVVEVDVCDEIRFKSDYPDIGIEYEKQSPFEGGDGPQAGQVFPVGQKPGPFRVKKPSNGTRCHFNCGEAVAEVGTGATQQHTTTTTFKFAQVWPGGGDTPNA